MDGVSRGFVGRSAELDVLSGLVEEALAGRGRLVVVAGEAGIGKTRLCQELSAWASVRSVGVGWSGCWEPSGLPPLWPWLQLLEQLGLTMPASPGGGADPEAARAGLFESVATLLRRATEAHPWLLVMDDVQWADAGTLRLLTYLAPLVRSMRLLVVVTTRDGTESAAPIRSTLGTLGALRRLGRLGRLGQVISVEPMSQDEVHELVAHVLDADPGGDVAAALHRATAGNPLFAEELARRLHRDGSLRAFQTDQPLTLPPTVRAVLGERLAAVSRSCRELLEYGAVVGPEFQLAVVADAARCRVTDVLVAIDEAEGARILTSCGPDAAMFAHPLLRAVLYDDIGVARRVELHRRVGEAFERRNRNDGRAGSDHAALSHHYLLAAPAGTAAKAALFSVLAARQAMGALAYDEAAHLFDRALTANELDPAGSDRGDLLVEAAEARGAAGDAQAARALYLAAADHARRAGRPVQLAAAALGLAGSGFEVSLFDDQQVLLLEEALAGISEGEAAWRARLQARLSVALSLAGQDERREALVANAVQFAERSGDESVKTAALAARCDAHAGPDHVAQRAADAVMIVEIAHRRGDHATELLGRRLRLVSSLEAGDLPSVDREIHEFAHLADWLHQPSYRWYSQLWRAMRAAMRGRVAEQARLSDEAEVMGRAAGSPNVEILLLAHRHFVWLEVGDVETYLAETERSAPPGSWEELGIQMLPLAVMRPLLAGRPEEAKALLDRSADALIGAPRDAEWLTLLAQIGDLCGKVGGKVGGHVGGHDLVPWLYATLLPYAELWSVDGIAAYAHGPVHRQLGTLAALLGRRKEATEHFDAALAGNRAAGAELLAARTLFDRGVALDDLDALSAARTSYRHLGIDRRVAEIDRLAHRTVPPSGPNTFRREGDVWEIRFTGRDFRVRDSKGMRDLARLLSTPGREIAAVDLASPTGAIAHGDLGETIDASARAAYKARLAELQTELDEADAAGDSRLSDRLLFERDAVVAQLRAAYGLGGRPRRSGNQAERARTTVTARIRDAIRRIQAVHPGFGTHLSRAVRTGAFCVYDPEPRIDWTTRIAPPEPRSAAQ